MPKIKELGITVVPEAFGPVEMGGGGWCGGCTHAFSNCTDCTFQPFSICGGTHQCQHWTIQPCARGTVCTDCTRQAFSLCGGTGQCQKGTFPCGGGSACGAISPVCGVSIEPPIDLTKAQIEQLKAQLKQQLEALEQHEKTLLPKTLEEVDAREKAITAELEQLKGIRSELKKK